MISTNSVTEYLKLSAALTAVLVLLFVLAEPAVSRSQEDTSNFTITQTILDETSFLVEPTNVGMSGNIYGITGGTANGTTQFVVQSNNITGYYVDIDFAYSTNTEAMVGETDGDESIKDYQGEVGGEPSYNFTTNTAAQFAYSVTSSTTDDTDQSFLSSGGTCNTGSTDDAEACWKAPTSTSFRIVDRGSAATTGATSTVEFRVNVPNNASSIPTSQNYTATATLSLYTQ